jgi:hypothetical protein
MADSSEPIPGARSLLTVVAVEGDGSGMRLQELCIRYVYASPTADAVAWMLRPGAVVAIIEGEFPQQRSLLLAALQERMDECQLQLKLQLLQEMEVGSIALLGTHAAHPGAEVAIGVDTLFNGQLDLANESLSDYRSDHTQRYWSLRVLPGAGFLAMKSELDKQQNPQPAARPPSKKSKRADAFIAALDTREVRWMEGAEGERIITSTKREAYDHLSKRHPDLFGTFETFSSSYAGGGVWTEALGFPIIWSNSRSLQ